MRETSLPPEFEEISQSVHYVCERIRNKEWSSSCPKCGGEPHQSGEFPDRFRMWPSHSSKIGIPIGWCRACGYKWTPKHEYKSDPEKMEIWKRNRIAEEIRRKQESERALEILNSMKLWEIYTRALDFCDDGINYWKGAGITQEFWWNEWGLGWDREHEFWCDINGRWSKHITPTATITERDLSGRIINIKHRLIVPQPDGTKYRMEYKTGIEPVFFTNLEIGNISKTTIITEGEKKAAVAWLTLDETPIQAFGLPKSPSPEMLRSISGEVVYYIPDPDAGSDTIKHVSEHIGDRLRVARLPEKIDDMIISQHLGKDWISGVLKSARKVR